MSESVSLSTFSEAAGLVSGAYLSGLSAAYQNLQDKWLSEITPAETKLQEVVDATRTAYENASSSARAFRDGAIAQGNTGMAAIMDKWSAHYQAKADAIASPIRTAAEKVSDLHASWSSSLNTFASQVPGVGTLVTRSLGPAVDLFGVGKGVVDLVETGETKSLANACWGIALAEAFGIVAGAFAAAVFAPGVLGIAIAVGVGAAAGSAVGGTWGDDISKWFSSQIVSGVEAMEELLFPARTKHFRAANVQQTRRLFNEAQYSSPLILDLDGDGVVQTRALGEGAYFDHDGNGLAESTGWVGAGDALLVRDLDGNGRIDGGAELFGNRTVVGTGSAAHGFAALASLDGNADGQLNAQDSAWASLLLWKDLNGDGRTDTGELITLGDAGVSALGTGYSSSTAIDAQGNQHRQIGGFTRSDGSSGAMHDVWFASDAVISRDADPIEVSQAIAALPDMQGLGLVRSLHQAMARDASGNLQSLVQAFVAGDGQGGPVQTDQLNHAFEGLRSDLYDKLMAQTHFKPLFDGLGLVFDETDGSLALHVRQEEAGNDASFVLAA